MSFEQQIEQLITATEANTAAIERLTLALNTRPPTPAAAVSGGCNGQCDHGPDEERHPPLSALPGSQTEKRVAAATDAKAPSNADRDAMRSAMINVGKVAGREKIEEIFARVGATRASDVPDERVGEVIALAEAVTQEAA